MDQQISLTRKGTYQVVAFRDGGKEAVTEHYQLKEALQQALQHENARLTFPEQIEVASTDLIARSRIELTGGRYVVEADGETLADENGNEQFFTEEKEAIEAIVNLLINNEAIDARYYQQPVRVALSRADALIESTRAIEALAPPRDETEEQLDPIVKKVFTKQDHDQGIYERNPQCWAYGLDLECVSPWNSRGNHTRAGTLISPSFIIFAEHYRIPPGETIRFVTADNQVIDREISETTVIGPSNKTDSYKTDFVIGKLNKPIDQIKPATLLPADADRFFDPQGTGLSFGFDKEEKALIQSARIYGDAWIRHSPPVVELLDYYETKVGGDSGNPCFIMVRGKPVLVTTWTFGGAGMGPAIHKNLTAIKEIVTDPLNFVNMAGHIAYQ